MSVSMKCNTCGSGIKGTAAEIIAWNQAHPDPCNRNGYLNGLVRRALLNPSEDNLLLVITTAYLHDRKEDGS